MRLTSLYLHRAKYWRLDIPTLQKVVVIPFVDQPFDVSDIKNGCAFCAVAIRRVLTNYWNRMSLPQFLDSAPHTPLAFEQLPFNQPLVILFSSGTTGTRFMIAYSEKL